MTTFILLIYIIANWTMTTLIPFNIAFLLYITLLYITEQQPMTTYHTISLAYTPIDYLLYLLVCTYSNQLANDDLRHILHCIHYSHPNITSKLTLLYTFYTNVHTHNLYFYFTFPSCTSSPPLSFSFPFFTQVLRFQFLSPHPPACGEASTHLQAHQTPTSSCLWAGIASPPPN